MMDIVAAVLDSALLPHRLWNINQNMNALFLFYSDEVADRQDKPKFKSEWLICVECYIDANIFIIFLILHICMFRTA